MKQYEIFVWNCRLSWSKCNVFNLDVLTYTNRLFCSVSYWILNVWVNIEFKWNINWKSSGQEFFLKIKPGIETSKNDTFWNNLRCNVSIISINSFTVCSFEKNVHSPYLFHTGFLILSEILWEKSLRKLIFFNQGSYIRNFMK